MSSKAALRHLALARRSALHPEEREERDFKIMQRLLSLKDFTSAGCVLFYVSFGSEVDTHDMMNRSFGGKTVLAPRVDGDNLHLHELTSLDDLKPGAYGILEPDASLPVLDPAKVDIIIVPGAAFDLRGHRIGYGKGYYDRLLNNVDALKIGLAYDRQMVEQVPDEPHDIPVDIIITNERMVDLR
ncbi:5-formyltetrahydrofolate cyclo-ligase [Cerasicoccus fimbriatus]|uniref:5-formyltetrahydrofolate cyclo-ligase n=1 Tax=Cerasicoccus fimbriatus TaxID=3014554 RepID=UPI0022B32847|nr:5-formyltetrahydrofolate cyclo-ligase [Cerasicoccus sp. TK19100]